MHGLHQNTIYNDHHDSKILRRNTILYLLCDFVQVFVASFYVTMRFATICVDSGQKLRNFVEDFLRRKDVVSRILTINTIRSEDLDLVFNNRHVIIISSIFGTLLDFVRHFIFVIKLILTLWQQNNDYIE